MHSQQQAHQSLKPRAEAAPGVALEPAGGSEDFVSTAATTQTSAGLPVPPAAPESLHPPRLEHLSISGSPSALAKVGLGPLGGAAGARLATLASGGTGQQGGVVGAALLGDEPALGIGPATALPEDTQVELHCGHLIEPGDDDDVTSLSSNAADAASAVAGRLEPAALPEHDLPSPGPQSLPPLASAAQAERAAEVLHPALHHHHHDAIHAPAAAGADAAPAGCAASVLMAAVVDEQGAPAVPGGLPPLPRGNLADPLSGEGTAADHLDLRPHGFAGGAARMGVTGADPLHDTSAGAAVGEAIEASEDTLKDLADAARAVVQEERDATLLTSSVTQGAEATAPVPTTTTMDVAKATPAPPASPPLPAGLPTHSHRHQQRIQEALESVLTPSLAAMMGQAPHPHKPPSHAAAAVISAYDDDGPRVGFAPGCLDPSQGLPQSLARARAVPVAGPMAPFVRHDSVHLAPGAHGLPVYAPPPGARGQGSPHAGGAADWAWGDESLAASPGVINPAASTAINPAASTAINPAASTPTPTSAAPIPNDPPSTPAADPPTAASSASPFSPATAASAEEDAAPMTFDGDAAAAAAADDDGDDDYAYALEEELQDPALHVSVGEEARMTDIDPQASQGVSREEVQAVTALAVATISEEHQYKTSLPLHLALHHTGSGSGRRASSSLSGTFAGIAGGEGGTVGVNDGSSAAAAMECSVGTAGGAWNMPSARAVAAAPGQQAAPEPQPSSLTPPSPPQQQQDVFLGREPSVMDLAHTKGTF